MNTSEIRISTPQQHANGLVPISDPLGKEAQLTAKVAKDLFASLPEMLNEILDYHRFQNQLLTFLEKNAHSSFTEWLTFCQYLDREQLPKSEKFILLRAASQCLNNPIEQGELGELFKQVIHLKSMTGVRLFQRLFTAKVPPEERRICDYIAACRLLTELHEEPDLYKTMSKSLPSLSKLVDVLQELEAQSIAAKYPERNTEETIARFGCKDNLGFPLSAEELLQLKAEYLEVKAAILELKKSPPLNVKEAVKQCAGEWCSQNSLPAKHRLIALLVESIRKHYKIAPYDTQIIAFLALVNTPEKMKGRIAQIKTGEGKSTMIALLTAYMACQNQFVDVVTSSSNLAARDCKKYAPFYQSLGLSASHIPRNPKPADFESQILYGTNTDFEFAALNDGLSQTGLRHSKRNGKLEPRTYDVAIIDEVDNLFLDTATSSAIISIPGNENYSWIYAPILEFVMNRGKNAAPFNEMAKKELRQYLMDAVPEQYHAQLASLSDQRLETWVKSAHTACYVKVEGRDYILKNSRKSGGTKVVIIDYKNTGRLNKGSQWRGGTHQFLQAKHRAQKVSITSESLTAASLSHPTYFGRYNHILGVTGTMGEDAEREEISKIYGVDSFDVPPHRPSLRVKTTSAILNNADEQYEAILENIKEMQKQGRPVLVLFESVLESKAFSEYIASKGVKNQLLNEMQREDEEYLTARAGDPGVVTIATNTAGRGNDFLLSSESKAAGGLHVIFAFYPRNLRVEEQGFGRAGRQGQPGSGCMILNSEDENIISLFGGKIIAPEDLIFALLNDFRTKRIKQESAQRTFCAEKEKIYFEKLQHFFLKMEEINQMSQDELLREAFKNKCLNRPPTRSETTENQGWQEFQITLSTLLEKQEVDWKRLFNQFHDAYLANARKQWAQFYHKLYEEKIDFGDFNAAKEQADEIYRHSEVYGYLSHPKEHALHILESLL